MVSSSGTTTDVSAAGVKPFGRLRLDDGVLTGREIRDVELTIVLAVADLAQLDRSEHVEAGLRYRIAVLVGDEDDQPARPAPRLLIFDRDLGGRACDDVDALAVRGLISRRRGHLFQPVATGWHGIETNDAVVGSVVTVAALDRLIAVALGQRPATPGHGIPLAISQREHDFTLAGRVLWGLHRLNQRRLVGRFDRGLLGSRLMRHEQSRPGRFDADGEIADGGEPRRGRGLAQGQRRGRYGVKDDRAVAIVVTNLESELDNGEARARQRLLGGIDRDDRQPPRRVTRLGHRLVHRLGAVRLIRWLLRAWLRLVRRRLIGAGGGKCFEPPGAELDALILGRRPALRSEGLTQGVVAVVETVWHAQPQQTIKLAIVGIAALSSQLPLAVDDREAGAGAGGAAGVGGGDVEPGITQRVLHRDRAGLVDRDDDPAGTVQTHAVLGDGLAIEEDLEPVASRLGVPGHLVPTAAGGGHGELLAEIGDQRGGVGYRLGNDLPGQGVVAEIDAGGIPRNAERDIGAVRVAALAKGALGVAGGHHAEDVVAGRHGEDRRP